MTIKTVVPELLAALPELKALCDEKLSYYGDELPDAYPVFDTVLQPAVFEAIDCGDSAFLRRAFAFYERVAADPDEDVNSLSHIELIEQLANDWRRLCSAWPYMGEATKSQARDYARAAKRQFGKDIPLPG